MVAALLVSFALAQGQGKPTMLARVFRLGERFTYAVRSNLQTEIRGGELDTFIPEELDINYDFTADVVKIKADGIAVLHYRRPKVTLIEGETFDSPPKATVENMKLDFLLTVSPVNSILEMEESKPPKPAKWVTRSPSDPQGGLLGQFIQELYRLALFAGSFDSALDFAPKLSVREVAVGESWHHTAGYQPQKLKGKSGQTVVQRLDYTYTYQGEVNVAGKSYRRVTADLILDTDLASFANQLLVEYEGQAARLKRLPLKLKASIEFDLDPKLGHTVQARANCSGGFQVFLTNSPQVAAYEERLKGRTTMSLKSIGKIPAPTLPKNPKPKPL